MSKLIKLSRAEMKKVIGGEKNPLCWVTCAGSTRVGANDCQASALAVCAGLQVTSCTCEPPQ
jgi:hypothetical protein